MRFNNAVTLLMVLSNAVKESMEQAPDARSDSVRQEERQALGAMLTMLSPFAPHLAEECAVMLAGGGEYAGTDAGTGEAIPESLVAQRLWPDHDPGMCVEDMVGIGVQINGKRRDSIELPR